MSSLLIIFGVSIAIIVILRLLVTALKYKADRTETFPVPDAVRNYSHHPQNFGVTTSGWRCENLRCVGEMT